MPFSEDEERESDAAAESKADVALTDEGIEENEALDSEFLEGLMEIPEEVELADGTKKPYGNVTYADPGYQEDGKERYPVDTEEHSRAAWSYINKAKNAATYTAGQLKKIKARVRSALKRHSVQVAMSDEQLTIENAAWLVALADRKEDTVPEEKKENEGTETTEEETTGFSDEEVQQIIAERDEAKAENERLKLGENERGIKDQIKGWEDDKFSPAILKVAEEVLLGEQTPEGVKLSSDGKEETVAVADIVKRLVEASPKVELEDTQVTEEDATKGNKPKEEAEEVELSQEVQDRARELYLHEGMSEAEAITKAQEEFDAKDKQ